MLQKIYFMIFERYIPELKKYDSISFLHQPMASGQPLKVVQRHMAHPVVQYMKIPNSDHVVYANCFFVCFCFDIQNNLCTQHVLSLKFLCTELVIQ